MGNPDEIMGEVVGELLKIDEIESVDIFKDKQLPDPCYRVIVYFDRGKKYIMKRVALGDVQTAIDMPAFILADIKKDLEQK